ncbi:hypothetical protein BBF96_04430 [Anoxybacter fermentans]|uniref:4Fe4S-binding SPASM domain-containing protein n=1 Tax=Anoxybacter fermentans TaxID=1323375 RepID=A0A3Q9HPF4_9FIRM|nr:radical SAM protein [Anoxybacter fermentans]AZR72703.1 hypothetical protein BBF96_04430 [Anoxybacter fermentans]
MIDFCVETGVEELNLLEYIPRGNAKDKDLVLSFEEELEVVKEIAKKYSQVKDVLNINPRFVRPLVQDYCKQCLGLDFPDVVHGCGAGTFFGFINNKGELYPCDWYVSIVLSEYSGEQINLTIRPFYDIWKEKIFDNPYELTEGSEFYQKYKPCNKCKYLKNKCYPCPVFGINKEEIKIKKCNNYFDLGRDIKKDEK